jgi:hypothetical protein
MYFEGQAGIFPVNNFYCITVKVHLSNTNATKIEGNKMIIELK